MFSLSKAVGRACCIERGVPQDCLGDCVRYDQPSFPKLPKLSSLFGRVDVSYSICDAYEQIARTCQKEDAKGKFIYTTHSNSSSFIYD